jgi:hypothetical protein
MTTWIPEGAIGAGCNRIVYPHPENPEVVIKRLRKPGTDYNQIEATIWSLVKDTEYEEEFCPLVWVSDDYEEFHMARAETRGVKSTPRRIFIGLPGIEAYPHKGDLKKSANYGRYNGKVVLLDYGNRHLLEHVKNKFGIPQ